MVDYLLSVPYISNFIRKLDRIYGTPSQKQIFRLVWLVSPPLVPNSRRSKRLCPEPPEVEKNKSAILDPDQVEFGHFLSDPDNRVRLKKSNSVTDPFFSGLIQFLLNTSLDMDRDPSFCKARFDFCL